MYLLYGLADVTVPLRMARPSVVCVMAESRTIVPQLYCARQQWRANVMAYAGPVDAVLSQAAPI